MTPRISFQERITRADVRSNRDVLYVFGDNLARAGRGGQAREMRGEPNTVGIPTKRSPSMAEDAFFTDDCFEEVVSPIREAFDRIVQHLVGGGNVVFPAGGIGTGLAQLRTRAPIIASFININIRMLVEVWGCDAETTTAE